MVEKLIVGGTRSGKKERLSELGFLDSEISDGAVCSLNKAFSLPALYHSADDRGLFSSL